MREVEQGWAARERSEMEKSTSVFVVPGEVLKSAWERGGQVEGRRVLREEFKRSTSVGLS